MTEIITLLDDAVVDVVTNWNFHELGCPTCGFGSDYCTEMTIYFKNHEPLGFEYHTDKYTEGFSVSYLIKLFCSNFEKFSKMTVEDFIKFITENLKKDFWKFEILE